MSDFHINDADFDRMRRQTDQLGDDLIGLIFSKHDVQAVNEFLQVLIENDEIQAEGSTVMPDTFDPEVAKALSDFFDKGREVPAWVDPVTFEKGQGVFHDFPMIAFSLLGCASLPELYVCGKGGTQILGATQELEHHVARRIFETAQMIIDVMARMAVEKRSDGGLEVTGRGAEAMLKVRLMHAAIRHLVLQTSENAPAEQSRLGDVYHTRVDASQFDSDADNAAPTSWGRPINQEIMGGTILSFSYVILRGLRDFGVRLSEEEEYAYIHAWSVVGHLMGIDDLFLISDSGRTLDYGQAEWLFDTVIARNESKTEKEGQEGRRLTAALLNFMTSMIRTQVPLGRFLPIRRMPKHMMVLLVGARKAAILGVNLSLLDYLILIPVQLWMLVMCAIARSPSRRHHLADWIFRRMVDYMDGMERGFNRAPFDVPEHLVQGWKPKQRA
jgi:hypothetical protein